MSGRRQTSGIQKVYNPAAMHCRSDPFVLCRQICLTSVNAASAAVVSVTVEEKCEMELREFYEFDFWPPESDRQVAAQLVAREVSALVAVRRSVSDVEWIQQVQSCISAALVRSAAQAEPTVTIGGADVDGGACQLTEGVMNAASNCRDERLTDVLSMMLSTMHRVRVGHVVAQWRAGLTRAAQQQSTQLTKRQRKRLLKGKKKDKRGRERGLARARWAGTWRAMVQRGVGSWVCAVGDQRIRRAAALVAAAVDAELVLCRRVWHELIDSFYWWQVGRGVVEQTACIERRSGGGDGCGGERVAYDWTCTRCGWGGQLVKAGCATCKKCEWQGWKWCEAAGSLDAEDREEAMENIVRKQQDFSGRRIGDRLRRRMLLESVRLKGMLEEKRVGMWQQQVLDTVQVGLQQGDTGDVRKLIAEAVDAAVGVQIGGVWLPRPRLRQSAKEYVVGEVQAAEEGSGWSGEAVGGGEESGEVAAADSESFQFLSYGVKPVDKAGRLPDWCDESEEEDENEGLEVWIAAEEAVEAANDALVAAEMAEDYATQIASQGEPAWAVGRRGSGVVVVLMVGGGRKARSSNVPNKTLIVRRATLPVLQRQCRTSSTIQNQPGRHATAMSLGLYSSGMVYRRRSGLARVALAPPVEVVNVCQRRPPASKPWTGTCP